jgi:hypothetical protein
MDTDGRVLVRDVRSHNDVTNEVRICGLPYESGCLLFNSVEDRELFVFVNNKLEIFDGNGRPVQRMEFDHNVVCAVQDKDTLYVGYQEGGLTSYDWNKDRLIDQLPSSIGPFKSLAISTSPRVPQGERVIVCGGERGEVVIIRAA